MEEEKLHDDDDERNADEEQEPGRRRTARRAQDKLRTAAFLAVLLLNRMRIGKDVRRGRDDDDEVVHHPAPFTEITGADAHPLR